MNMDFNQFILNESYVLTPYKICVANFICAYLEYRQSFEDSLFAPNIVDYGYLIYKLIMSIDCTYDELLFRISLNNNNNNTDSSSKKIATEIMQIFHKELNRQRRDDIKYFHDFFDKIRLLIQKKLFKNRISPSSNLLSGNNNQDNNFIDLSSGFFHHQIHKMSLIGIFLRKLMIYYERLSYNETSTLFDQLQNYLKLTNFDNHNNITIDTETIDNDRNEFTINEKLFKKLNQIEMKLNKNGSKFDNVYIDNMKNIISKLKSIHHGNNDPNDSNKQLSLAIDTFNSQITNKRKLSDDNSNNSLSMDISMDIENNTSNRSSSLLSSSNKNILNQSVPMDIDETDLSVDDNHTTTISETSSNLEKSGKTDVNIDFRNDNNNVIMEKISKKFVNYDTFEHFIIKQIYKIQFNEKLALTPKQVIQYLREKFTENNMFYYNRFITYNYLGNLNLVLSSGCDSGQDPGVSNEAAVDNRANNDIIQAGYNGLIASANGFNIFVPSMTGPITLESSDREYRSLFRSINFFNDIEYLKFINALRINNYTVAREAFFDYFDLKKPSFESETECLPHPSQHAANVPIRNGGIGNGTIPDHNRANVPRTINTHNPSSHHHHNIHQNHYGFRNQRGVYQNETSTIMDFNTSHNLMFNSSNYCWSSLNLAMMYYHFKYYRLAYDALVDCLSLAREKREERCLQYAMLWILQISKHLDHSKPIDVEHLNLFFDSENNDNGTNKYNSKHNKVYSDLDLVEDIIRLILTNRSTLPYILAKTFLHFQHLQYLKPSSLLTDHISLSNVLGDQFSNSNNNQRSPFLPHPFYLSIKYRIFDALGEQFSMISAILNAYGATHLAATYSQLFLRMDVIEKIMEERIFRLDESTMIAIRNMAHYLYFVRGDLHRAIDLIKCFRKHFSSYDQRAKQIMEQALIEISFDYYVGIGQWNSAVKCLNSIRCLNRTRSYYMLAQLRFRQNEPITALECLDLIMPYTSINGALNHAQMTSMAQTHKLSGSKCLNQNLFQSYDSNDSNYNGYYEDYLILTKKKKQTSSEQFPKPKPMPLRSFYSNNLNYYERIQPPPPEELEPENERKLVPELDPYTTIECNLMRGMILQDLSILFECVEQSLLYGYKQLEFRSLIQIARIQSEQYGQHQDAMKIIELLIHRSLSQSILKDIAELFYVYASILYRINIQKTRTKQQQKQSNIDNNNKLLSKASKLIKRSILIYEHVNDRQKLHQSLKQAALIENENGNISARNFYSKHALLMIKSQLIV